MELSTNSYRLPQAIPHDKASLACHEHLYVSHGIAIIPLSAGGSHIRLKALISLWLVYALFALRVRKSSNDQSQYMSALDP